MNLYEYQGKEIFQQAGIPIQPQKVVRSVDDAVAAAEGMKMPVVLKAQVLAGGRGKAGGVKLALNAAAVRQNANAILGMKIKGILVEQLLVTEAVDIEKEYYLSVALDRTSRQVLLIISSDGGVDIEELAETRPEKIHKLSINLTGGIDSKKLTNILLKSIESTLIKQVESLIHTLYDLLIEKDCMLVEVNPLALVGGTLCVLDAKVVIDDNALFKHDDLNAMKSKEEYSDDEEEARKNGLSFVGMDGNIGCIVNGAGLAMATMDIIKLFGGNPANFLDVGGSSDPNKVIAAIRIILRNPNVKVILLNIFGGITRCDDIAKGLISATEQLDIRVPLVVRLVGTNQKEGAALLEAKGFEVESKLSDSVEKSVALERSA